MAWNLLPSTARRDKGVKDEHIGRWCIDTSWNHADTCEIVQSSVCPPGFFLFFFWISWRLDEVECMTCCDACEKYTHCFFTRRDGRCFLSCSSGASCFLNLTLAVRHWPHSQLRFHSCISRTVAYMILHATPCIWSGLQTGMVVDIPQTSDDGEAWVVSRVLVGFMVQQTI